MNNAPKPELSNQTLHAASILDWFEAGGEDIEYWREEVDEIIAETGYIPIVQFTETYERPDSEDPIFCHRQAVDFLGRQEKVTPKLLANLNAELDESRLKLDAGRATGRAAKRAEALALGRCDPWSLINLREVKLATDTEWW